MSSFKSGDKVIMKDHVRREDIQEFGIDGEEIDEIKWKISIVDITWIDEDGIDVVGFKDSGYIWRSEWFKYVNPVPDELFEIEE